MNIQTKDKIWGTTKATLSPTCLSALRLKYCLEDLGERKGKILEVGCGAGMFCLAIENHRPDFEVYGCDLDQKAIAVAKKRSQKIKFLVGDAYQLPFKDEFFEVVVFFDVLEHLEKPRKALSEIWRVLKPDSLLHFFVPCEGDFYTLHGFLNRLGITPKGKYAGHVQQLTLKNLQRLLKKEGFAIIKQRFSSHYFSQLIDLGYFLLLSLLRKDPHLTIEAYLEKKKSSKKIGWQTLSFLKAIVAIVSYGESLVFKKIPAHGAHLSCLKTEKKQ